MHIICTRRLEKKLQLDHLRQHGRVKDMHYRTIDSLLKSKMSTGSPIRDPQEGS